MNQLELAAVLLPFGQGNTAMNLSPEVTGLELPISKPMFELLDGELTLESQLNQRTTVRILCPRTHQIV